MDNGGSAPSTVGAVDGKALLLEGRHREALESFAEWLPSHPEDGDAFDGASRALIELIREGTIHSTLDPAGRDRLYRTLIQQEQCTIAPPVLHHLIAARMTSGDPETARKAAAELGPTLADLCKEGKINAKGMLMVLVLRNELTRWISQEEISRRHLECFPAYRLTDLSLPYSCMFSSHEFWRNRDDLARIFEDPGLAAKHLEALTLVQIVFLEWLLEIDLVGADVRSILEARLKGGVGAAEPEEVAAAKTLLVRHGLGSAGVDAAFVGSLGLEPSLFDLVEKVGEARERIEKPSAGSTDGLLFSWKPWQAVQAARNLAGEKAPFAFRRRRKPRAAICISGQLRGYKVAFETWRKTLLPLFDHDIFVHSWTRIGRSGAEPYRHVLPFEGAAFQQKYRETCLMLGFEEFRKLYPYLFQVLSATGQATVAEIAAFYGSEFVRLDDESHEPFSTWGNPDKMHGKLEACFNLVVESGREYDLIVRIRPDLPIKLAAFDPWQLNRLCHRSRVIFADHGFGLHYVNPMIGDQMAFAAFGPMQVYSSTFTLQPDFARHQLLQVPAYLQGHSSLAQICWAHGIAVEKIPIRVGKLTDAAPLGLGEIKQFLEQDAKGRDNWTDQQLLEAVAADMRAKA